MRANSDEAYVIDLCDTVLGRTALRGSSAAAQVEASYSTPKHKVRV